MEPVAHADPFQELITTAIKIIGILDLSCDWLNPKS
jgi:hypothetical protein